MLRHLLSAAVQDAASAERLNEQIDKCNARMDESLAADEEEEFGLVFHADCFKACQKAEEQREHKKRDNESSNCSPRLSLQRLKQKVDEKTGAADDDEDEESLQTRFFDLAARCKSVVACRLEPKEKADIVKIMKKRTKAVCLAIGDGNNGQQSPRTCVLLHKQAYFLC
jgi:hypothetical protein